MGSYPQASVTCAETITDISTIFASKLSPVLYTQRRLQLSWPRIAIGCGSGGSGSLALARFTPVKRVSRAYSHRAAQPGQAGQGPS